MIWVRWTLPRLRIDQVMTMCLKYCVPLAAICFVGVLVWQVLGLPGPNDWLPVPSGPAGVRETWVVQPASQGERETPAGSVVAPAAAAAERFSSRPRPAPTGSWRTPRARS